MTDQGEQLSFFGQLMCLEKSMAEHAQWIENARERFLAALESGPKTIDEVIGERPKGMNPNAIGAMVGGLSRSGQIVMIGVRQAGSTSRHAGLNRVWELAKVKT